MLRRKPTRVELTTEDVQDYEAIKKEAEEKRKKQQLEIDRTRANIKTEQKPDPAEAREASRREVIASRIGLRP